MKNLKTILLLIFSSAMLFGCTTVPYYYQESYYTPVPVSYLHSNRIAVISTLGPDINYLSSLDNSYSAVSGGVSRIAVPEWNIDAYAAKAVTNNLEAKGYQIKNFQFSDNSSKISPLDLQNLLDITRVQGYDTVIMVDTNIPLQDNDNMNYPGYGFYRTNANGGTTYNAAAYATLMLHVYQKGAVNPVAFGDKDYGLNTTDSDPVRLIWRNDFSQYSPAEKQILEQSLHDLLDRKITDNINQFLQRYYYSLITRTVRYNQM